MAALVWGAFWFMDKYPEDTKPADEQEIVEAPIDEEELPNEEEEAPIDEEEMPQTSTVTVSEYILPTSNTAKLTRADLSGLTKEQLRIARNEIFARHGMIFGAQDLANYFSGKSWYKPSVPFDDFYDKVEMSSIEEINVKLILEVEEELE